jgi:glutathionyl-hydroquinone reductase
LGPLLFLLYTNDLPKIINDKTIPILFTDDTSLLVTSTNHDDLHKKLNTAFHDINELLKANQLPINVNKTHYIQFTSSNNNPLTEIKVAYNEKSITLLSNIKFLGIYIDDKMSWKHHIEQISPKLNRSATQ